jgi:hypothetical protein
MLGGDVGVQSTVGVGSVFSVTIPIAIPGHAAVPSQRRPLEEPDDGR